MTLKFTEIKITYHKRSSQKCPFKAILNKYCKLIPLLQTNINRIDGIMVSVLALSAVDCGFEPRSGQTKDYKMAGHFNIGHYYVLHMHLSNFLQNLIDSIGGIMVSVLALSVVDCGFEPWSGQTKDYKTDICCFTAKHTAFSSKSKD